MMFKKRLGLVMLCMMFMLMVSACDNDDDDNDGFAPSSIANQNYQLTLTSATGVYAGTSGVWNIAFLSTGNYTITTQEGISIDAGTYTYQKKTDNRGEITLSSVGSTVATCVVNYTSATAGTFSISASIGTGEGSFTRL